MSEIKKISEKKNSIKPWDMSTNWKCKLPLGLGTFGENLSAETLLASSQTQRWAKKILIKKKNP
jgi:hypothetical protein